jgi:glycosyltransferase involved in cell wall biosynthesis
MAEKPELIVFSQNLLGGGASFHRNMLAHFPRDFFDIKCIYLDPTAFNGTRSLELTLGESDHLFSFGNEPVSATAKRLSKLVSNTQGAIVTNLVDELIMLDLHPKSNKTVYFICHDDGFLDLATTYVNLIDVYIAHNVAVYHTLQELLPHRKADIHFIQHGVNIPAYRKNVNTQDPLRIVFLARHYTFKGLYDLPVIDDLLREMGVQVNWTVLGDGPERANFMNIVANRPNFRLEIPPTSEAVLDSLKEQDIFILPSRKDGLPVALLEAMSVGCVPLLGNFSEGIKKVVTEQIGFVLPAGENALFAEKIAALSKDRQLLATFSRNSMEKVDAEFDIRKQALEYYKLYKTYKQLKKRHKIHLRDLYRKAGYYQGLNKLIHITERLRKKLTSTP